MSKIIAALTALFQLFPVIRDLLREADRVLRERKAHQRREEKLEQYNAAAARVRERMRARRPKE